MAADNNSADEPNFDPLTSPAWMLEEDDDILLAPPLEEFFSDVSAAISPGPVGPPPKIDDIITGGYTGWVPIIKAGESLAQAEARAAQAQQSKPQIEVEAPTLQMQVPTESETVISETDNLTSVSKPIVDDPDLVTSPSQALDQARKRIAAMRASLQLNLNQVAESFAHPIFTPPTSDATVANENLAVSQAPVQNAQSSVPVNLVSLETVSTEVPTPRDSTEDSTAHISVTQPSPELPFSVPQATRIFTPTETQTQPETEVQSAPADHSLELMIMRDEIKDLRDRLDSSQKLIEELMHRLANLAELALKRQ